MKSALTIAASDPSGGAGVQADLKAFTYAGVHGCTVITCVTAQNTEKVSQIHEIPLEIIEAQLDAILEDIKISACKTGMLYSPSIVNSVAKKCAKFDFPVVVDPVMKATVGGSLHEPGFIEALTRNLIPKSNLVTPNIPEAMAITDQEIKSIEDMKDACKKIHDLGCRYVLLKGGHLEEQKATDVLFDGKDFRLYLSKSHPRILHGTGCTFSALITAFLARGKVIEDAVEEAKLHIGNLIERGYEIGEGVGVANVMPEPTLTDEKLHVMRDLVLSVNELVGILPFSFVPEVGTNIGFALEKARGIEDVCALEGRLFRAGERIDHSDRFRFGASRHIARIILTAMEFSPKNRSAMNIKFDEKIIDTCTSLGFTIGSFDRSDEPKSTTTMEWGTEFVIKQSGKIPDIIYDKGAIGKEPMIRILGKNPQDVVGKLKQIKEKCGAEN
jgi:hydroxymethylpyrimidine kinase/phosphomethylpyrimidine kinase